MPTYFARKSGMINAADVWATTPTGTAAAVTFVAGDVLMANSFTITVNISTDLGSTGQVRNDTNGGATLGGSFTLTSGGLLRANIFSAYFSNGSACVSSGTTSAIEGNITVTGSGNASSQLNRAVIFTGGAGTTLTITGNIIVPSSFNHIRVVDFAASGGNLIITGNLVGNSASGSNAIVLANSSTSSTGAIAITGNITGGAAHGLNNTATNASVTCVGTVTGGNNGVFGISNADTSTVTITGFSVGGIGGAGVSNSSTGTIRITRAVGNDYGPGNTAGLASAVGAINSNLGVIEVEQLEYGLYGQSPTTGTGIRLKKASSNSAVFNYCDTAGAKTLVDATQANQPAEADVRSGVSYASGALTGTCAVPAAGSVALGVPVDATTGTAALTPEAVWNYNARTITGGTVNTLTNAPTVPSASAIASQVRTELTAELAKVSALNPTRLAQVATTEIVGSLLAQANS